MEFKIPFTLGNLEKQKKKAKWFKSKIKFKERSALGKLLHDLDVPATREEYISICLKNAVITFAYMIVFATTMLFLSGVSLFFLYGPIAAILFAGFIFLTQMNYPRIYNSRKQSNIEKNLISGLEDMLVQLNAGIPLFNIIVNISASDYGMLSYEFSKAAKKINAGLPELEVLENIGEENSSIFFRRTLWQLSNGMRSGSDISIIIKDSIRSLNEEQMIQIQNYGNKLNPMIMFYMLVSVILPALSITFLTVISSLVNLPQSATVLLFIGLFVGVIFVQVSFVGLIRSLRPSLL
jgi:pilus assembly protein TadC